MSQNGNHFDHRRTVVLEDEGLRVLHGFTQIPNAILKHPTLSFGAKVVYGVLLSYAWREDFCYPAQETIAKDTNCSIRQVQRLLIELKSAGALYWKQQGLNRPNVYYITALASWLPPNLLKNKDTTNMSPPDTTYLSGPDATNSSHKEYSVKNIKNVNVNALLKPLKPEPQEEPDEAATRTEGLVLEMVDTLKDPHSAGFYRLVARTLPHQVVFRLLSETRDVSARGAIRRSRGAHFTDAVMRYAADHGYNLRQESQHPGAV